MSAYTQLSKWDQETKIPQMDLEQIKTMMCPISGGDHLKCVGCKSIKTCQAGQRVVVLLDQETKSKRMENLKIGYEKRRSEARSRAMQAAKADDPVQWVIENTNCSRKSALQKLLNWKKDFPEVMEGYEPKQYQNYQRDKARENLINAINSGDPIRYYQVHGNTPRKRALKIINNGLERYPDIKEMYDKAGWGKEEDEVSIEDFLDDLEAPETAQEQPSEVEVEEMPIEEEKPVKTENKDDFESVLSNKYNQLEAEKGKLKVEIEKLEEQMKWLNDQQEAISKVISLFAKSTETTKLPFTE